MKVAFLTNGPIEWASARYRGFWIAECRDDWQAYELEKIRQVPDADAYVFAKVISLELVEMLKDEGKQVWWDLCDPMHWFDPDAARAMVALADGVVCSNQGLADDFSNWSGVKAHTIPDRLKLSHYDKQRQHQDGGPVRFIWFGSAQNRPALAEGYVILGRLKANGYKVELTIMDNRPGLSLEYGPDCPVYFIEWNMRTEVEAIAAHDIALLPDYPGPWGTVKSTNKVLSAWACGVPEITDCRWHQGIIKLVESSSIRQFAGKSGRELVEAQHTVDKSADEWEALLCAS
jgi:hypothetical protein